MSEKRRGLGRGLGSLIPTQPERAAGDAAGRRGRRQQVGGAYFAEIPIEAIVPNARQPREVFEADAMAELVHSIKEIGLLQPVVVRQAGRVATS